MNSFTSSTPNQQLSRPTRQATLSISSRLTRSEIDALRQNKKSIADYVQRELPARLVALQRQLPTNKVG